MAKRKRGAKKNASGGRTARARSSSTATLPAKAVSEGVTRTHDFADDGAATARKDHAEGVTRTHDFDDDGKGTARKDHAEGVTRTHEPEQAQ